MRKILEACPSCGGPLEIAEVRCTRCDTQVRARYRPCDFCSLTEEQSTFLRLFVTTRGNLSEVEKRLGVSYPTVRAKLDEIIERLGSAEAPARQRGAAEPAPAADVSPAVEPPPHAPLAAPSRSTRREILEAVARGEIDPVEATAQLRALGGARARRSSDVPEV